MNTDHCRWRSLIFLIVLVASVAPEVQTQGQAQAQRPSEQVGAIVRLKQIVAEHPEDAAARVELGNALDDAGDSAGAIAQYREAIRLRPEFAPAYRNMALANIRQGQWQAAESAARNALRIEPAYVQARCDLAVALGSQHKTDAAAREWQQAIELDASAVAKYPGFVRTPAEAEEFSRAAPALAAGWLVALTLRDAGDRGRAIRELERLLVTDRSFALANLSLAELYAQSGKPKESDGALQKALLQNPGLKESAERTVNAAGDEETKARSQAKAQLADFKGIVPGLIQMQHLRGASEEQVTKARELLKESAIRMKALLESFPEDADGYLLLGDALRELQEPRTTWAYEMAIRAARGRRPAAAGRAWMELGRLQANAGHDAAALEMYSQGLQAAPEYPELLNMAAWLAATSEDQQVRNPQQAIEWAQKAVESSKGKNAAYLSTLAEAYFASGQMIAAVRTLSIAMALEPDEATYRKQMERFQKAIAVN